ncbi:MAG TPA: SDR family NAD(P)-dependent oxidoreductase [Solirubrobacteraceae bacterium]|nr:SDR family NAD(P)-dependent oxidoreductase [Solirubrobacteraceae bacterium]
MIGAALDTALDLTVVGGYTSLGYRLRRPFFNRLDPTSMRGRTVLVTGATSGLGHAAAEGFAALGADVWLLARDRERGEDVRAAIAERAEGTIRLELCDLADLASIRAFAQRFTERAEALHVLVNNAGVLTERRELSPDGIELTFAVNVVAGFALTRALLGPLTAGAPSRVINVSSGGMYTQRLRAEDLQSAHGPFDGAAVYARSKRAEVVLTEMWAQRLRDTGVTVHSMHPGWADTPGVKSSLPRFYRATKPLLRTPQQGADTIVWLGAADEPGRASGGFWHDRRRRPTHLLPSTRETAADRDRLWAECERLAAGA